MESLAMMSGQIQRFKCELCENGFDSAEELDEHNTRMQEPQPTLPTFDSDLRGGAQ
jgi:hypothetical protein